jgi:DNA-binding NtrC family response regulator
VATFGKKCPIFLDLTPLTAEVGLKATGGAQAEEARKLGLSRSDLSYKLSKFGIKNPP